MKQVIDFDKEAVEESCLTWSASDIAYKVEHWVDIDGDFGKDYEIIDKPTEEHRQYLQDTIQCAIEENSDRIIEKINELLWDYMIDNKTEIISDLIDNKYLKKMK